VGAILVQNTSWTNVERGDCELESGGGAFTGGTVELPERKLAELIRRRAIST